jgi:Protein of unknown function (DUF1488)
MGMGVLSETTSLLTGIYEPARTISEHSAPSPRRSATAFFEFPEDAHWNAERDTVEFSVILRPYEGSVRIGRRVFQRLLDQSPTPERCVEAFHLQRTRFEMIAERKVRRRQLTDDGNVEITGRDLREKARRDDREDIGYRTAS